MKKIITLSALMITVSLLAVGCSTSHDLNPPSSEAPLVSEAQGLGKEKVDMSDRAGSVFEIPYESLEGKANLEELEAIDWEVERILDPADGDYHEKGDTFRFVAAHNMDLSDVIKDWIKTMEKDGWEKANEVAPPEMSKEDAKMVSGSAEDNRNKPYSTDLSKGETTFKININPSTGEAEGNIVIVMNSK